ncbi:MAG: ABC transporter permease [Cyclobacteriaceae bacterium]
MKQKNIPPKWADRFFLWYCTSRLSETILGDLHENYLDEVAYKGKFRADLNYWLNVLKFINRHTLKRNGHHHHTNQTAMLKNYLLIAFRKLMRNRVYSAINIFGLAVGFASCLIISIYVWSELSYDQFHSNHQHIYRVTNTFERTSGQMNWARTPPALAPGIQASITGIKRVSQLRYADDHTYAVGTKIFRQGNVFYADAQFLQIFDFELKSGDPTTALSAPHSIVITEQMGTKYFGDTDPMGQLISFDGEESLVVTGVLKSLPDNSHISFDMLISFESFEVPDGYLADLNSWSWAGFHTYVELEPHVDPTFVNAQIIALYKQNFNRANIGVATTLQPLQSIYLDSGKYTNVGASINTGNRATIYGLSLVAALILSIASFNFMNLSTASSLTRGKEVGLRKVMGAVKSKVIWQFLIESVMVSTISLLVALLLIGFGQQYFSSLLGIQIHSIQHLIRYFPIMLGAAMVIGLLSGAYPALVLAAFNPISALKGGLKTGQMGAYIRKGLMVIQFGISMMLIAGSIVIVTQMNFIKNKQLGFDKENVLHLKMLSEDLARHYTSLKNKFEAHPQVLNVAVSTHVFDGSSSSGPARRVGAPEDQAYQIAYYQTDYDFLKLTGVRLVSGRFFSKDFVTDSSAMLLNESAVDIMELDQPLGARIHFAGQERTIIGVYEDFHFASLHSQIGPMAMLMPFASPESVLIKLAPGDMSKTLNILERDWKSIVGATPFDATFIADGIQSMYEQEEKLASLISVFSALAVVLACLGLYGLVTYAVQSKLKEVGIRKVLGSSLQGLLLLLSKQFFFLILIGVFLASPLVYLFTNQWLGNFAYRIDFQWWIVAVAGCSLLVIAIITISFQTIKAAKSNPVEVLRSE